MKKNVNMKKKITIFSAHPSLISSFHIGFFFFLFFDTTKISFQVQNNSLSYTGYGLKLLSSFTI